ncbi:MAG: cytochrome c peroxidase [Chitinophagales bacterium]
MRIIIPLLSSIFIIIACSDDTNNQHAQVSKSGEKHSVIALQSHCPPGFELNDNNECINRNMYQMYNSSNDKGVGGLQTGLPQNRDGFSPQQIDLGRYLFFDPVLSIDGSISCASCHQPDKGFSDGLAISKGVKGKPVHRSAPSIWNSAFIDKFFWDAKSNTLEDQMQGPLYSENEMGNNPTNLLQTLNKLENYQALFLEAFPEKEDEEISLNEIYTALTAFECSLISLNSPYDQYAHGYHDALNEQEIEGMNIFRSFVARCAECHTPPLFTNQQLAVIGTPEPKGRPFDKGAEVPTGDKTLRGSFKVPSLRNIALTAPYEHSGVFDNLYDATEFYTKGRGHAVPDSIDLIVHWHIWEPQLSVYEIERIVDFLHTLTDESFKPQIPQAVPSGLNLEI